MALRRIGVVGASLAGLRTIEALRAGGYDGTIVAVGDETDPPYNRPPLSKQFLTTPMDPADLALPTRSDLQVDWRLGTRATRLLLGERKIETTSHPIGDLDALVVATGAAARRLPMPGLAGIHTLRTVTDAVGLRDSLARGGPVAVIGAGLIGCEIASSCRQLDIPVTLIDPAATPMGRAVGPQAGQLIADLHRRAGVDLRLRRSVTGVSGTGRVQRLSLSDGIGIDIDTLVVAVGSAPVTDWLATSGLSVDDGVVCDGHCQAVGGDGHVVAAGDVCRWPATTSGTERGEHWTGAAEQAAIAADTLLHGPRPGRPRPVPFFWSSQHHHRIQAVGRPADADATTLVAGDNPATWTMTFTRHDQLVGAVAIDMPGRIARARRQLVAQQSEQPARTAVGAA